MYHININVSLVSCFLRGTALTRLPSLRSRAELVWNNEPGTWRLPGNEATPTFTIDTLNNNMKSDYVIHRVDDPDPVFL